MGRRGGRRSRWLSAAVVGTVVGLALLAGTGQDRSWAEHAVQWIQARDRASHRSVADKLMFEAPDTVDLACCNQSGPTYGRDALASFLTGMFDYIDDGMMGRAYLDVSGSVVEYRFPAAAFYGGPSGSEQQAYADELQVSENAANGAATRTVHPMALKSIDAAVERGWWPYYRDDLAVAQGITERYLSAWSGDDARMVGGLYSETATVVDSLLGVRLTGRDAIGSYVARHGGAPLRLDGIPDGGGPALYGYWRENQSHLTAYVTYIGDEGIGCPGGVTAELQIEQAQIVAERRYHDVASMRRCVESAQLPEGWWTRAIIPPPIEDRVTGTVTVAGRRVEVHNGNAVADELVRSAMSRFPAVHLTAPAVASVVFIREPRGAKCSSDLPGLALRDGSSSKLYLCLTVDGTATTFARELLLHELAHPWMWQNLAEPIKEQFVARLHLPTWDATDVPRDQRGMERAAEVIAWGLAGGQLISQEFPGQSCADLIESFQLLTGEALLQLPCR